MNPVLALISLVFAPLLIASTAPAQEGATVTVTVTDLRNSKGIVRACMTADEATFPRCRGVPGAYGATAQAKEGFGFSRDAKVRMGPPRFSDAAIDIGAQDRNLTIRMRYML